MMISWLSIEISRWEREFQARWLERNSPLSSRSRLRKMMKNFQDWILLRSTSSPLSLKLTSRTGLQLLMKSMASVGSKFYQLGRKQVSHSFIRSWEFCRIARFLSKISLLMCWSQPDLMLLREGKSSQFKTQSSHKLNQRRSPIFHKWIILICLLYQSWTSLIAFTCTSKVSRETHFSVNTASASQLWSSITTQRSASQSLWVQLGCSLRL